jgi:hypothetical protein
MAHLLPWWGFPQCHIRQQPTPAAQLPHLDQVSCNNVLPEHSALTAMPAQQQHQPVVDLVVVPAGNTAAKAGSQVVFMLCC